MQSLKSIIIHFGEKKYGIAGDIANMFFQINIAPEDQDMLRILWFDGPGMQGDVAVYRFQVAPYGLRCIPSIAGFSMLYTAEKNIPDVFPDVTSRVMRDMFVEDFITGVDSIEDGKRVIYGVSKLLSSTGFKLTKWNASSKDILSTVATEDLAPSRRDISEKQAESQTYGVQTTIGLIWDTNTDEFFLKVPDLNVKNVDEQTITKRHVVSINNRLFNPLSWWAPLYIQMNLTCSKIVRQVESWDESLSPELTKEWLKAINGLGDLDQVPVPRCEIPKIIILTVNMSFTCLQTAAKMLQLLPYISELFIRIKWI